ncbi:hypothetical protein ES703_45538 [subsurface metagenome]
MSFAITNWLRVYAEWRERYLQEHPEKRLFPWLFGGLKDIPKPSDPIITLNPEIKKRGIMVLVILGLVLASGRSD